MLKEDEALREDRLARTSTDIVLWHVADQKKSENLLEKLDLIVIKRGDQLSELLPGDALATDVDVGEELVELLFSKFSSLRSCSTCWLFRRSCYSGLRSFGEQAISEVLESKRKQLAESLACNNDLHVERSEAMRSCVVS